MTDTTGSQYQLTELLLLHDGSNTSTTEYATLNTGTSIALVKSDISGANVRLLISPNVAPLQVNISRTLLGT